VLSTDRGLLPNRRWPEARWDLVVDGKTCRVHLEAAPLVRIRRSATLYAGCRDHAVRGASGGRTAAGGTSLQPPRSPQHAGAPPPHRDGLGGAVALRRWRVLPAAGDAAERRPKATADGARRPGERGRGPATRRRIGGGRGRRSTWASGSGGRAGRGGGRLARRPVAPTGFVEYGMPKRRRPPPRPSRPQSHAQVRRRPHRPPIRSPLAGPSYALTGGVFAGSRRSGEDVERRRPRECAAPHGGAPRRRRARAD